LEKQKNIYYILGRAFIYYEDGEVNDKDNIITALNINNIEHQADKNSVDAAPEINLKGSGTYTMTENLTQENLLEKEEITEIEKTKEVAITKEVEKAVEIENVAEVVEVTKIEEVAEIEEVEAIKEVNEIEEINIIKEIKGVDIMSDINNEVMNIMQARCGTGLDPNCGECCAVFTDTDKREAFGYQLAAAACVCHDICVEDVKDICVKRKTLRYCIPCNADGRPGCRGGFTPDETPEIESYRVKCADENLSPETGCDRIINNIEFEVVLKYDDGLTQTRVIVTPKDRLRCLWHHFAKFPSGDFYTNDRAGRREFREELKQIDGSCKVIIIENVYFDTIGNDCLLIIEYKVIDKLWKHENLLVSAIKPYGDNITVSEEFDAGHKVGRCEGSGPCGGIPIID
jgi:hypothetical protein